MTLREVVTRAWEGEGAELYERVRPGYPQSAIDFIAEELGIGPGSDVLDLAAGTGKLTRALLPLGCRLTAVEPLEGMRKVLARELSEVTALAGSAEEIPLDDASMDVVLAGQAFHWFDRERAPREIARVLRPGGGLVAIWNTRDESVGWMNAVREVIEHAKGDTPRHRDDEWRRGLEESGLFGPLGLREFEQVQELSREEAIEVFASRSYVAALPDDERAQALEQIAVAVPP
ncbi:MAG: class I SAM-dependent methyltransferase, partial [Thermoleophilaceae bacterium]